MRGLSVHILNATHPRRPRPRGPRWLMVNTVALVLLAAIALGWL